MLAFLFARPRATLLFGLLLASLCWAGALRHLAFTTDRTRLLDPQNPVQRDWERYRASFGQNADFLVFLRSASQTASQGAADLLQQRLQASPRFTSVFCRLDAPELSRHGLYFLKLTDLQELLEWLRSAGPWLDILAQHSGAGGLMKELSSFPSASAMADRIRPVLPLLTATMKGMAESLESGGRSKYVSAFRAKQADVPMLAGHELQIGQTRFYNMLADGKTLLLVARAKKSGGDFKDDLHNLRELRDAVYVVRRSFPEVYLLVSGEPAVNTEEMETARREMIRTAFYALAGVAGIMILGFGQLRRPLCAVAALFLGLSWTLGFATLAVGELNLLTVNFAAILTGLGMTFGIQILAHYQVCRQQGSTAMESVLLGRAETRHQAVGAVATSVAFLSLVFTSFQAAVQLGWISGIGVLLCYASMVSMLPCLLILVEGDSPDQSARPLARLLIPIERIARRKHFPVAVACLVFSVVSLFWITRVPFDFNLLNLQSPTSEAVRVESFLRKSGYSSLFASSMAPSPAVGRKLTRQLQALPSVQRVESVLSLEPNSMAAKRPLVTELVRLAKTLRVPVEPERLDGQQLLAVYQTYLGMRERLLDAARQLAEYPEGKAMPGLVARMEAALNPNNPGPLTAGLEAFQQSALADLRTQLAFLKQQKPDPPDILALLPPELRVRALAPDGTVTLRIFAKEDIWEHQPLEQFVAELRKVDPHITGSPVLILTYLKELQAAYNDSARNALIAITVLLLVYYRSLPMAGLALLPKLVGVCWMLAVLAWTGQSFNPANFLALPLTLGIGLIFGIEALRACRHPERLLLSQQSAGFALSLSALTTMAGFSVLITADHRGISSFGVVMTVGVGMNLLAAVVMLPSVVTCYRSGRYRATLFKSGLSHQSPEQLDARDLAVRDANDQAAYDAQDRAELEKRQASERD